jgi:hypothetical protein
MERSAVGMVNPAQAVQRRPRDAMIRASGLALLAAIAAAAFGRGAFFIGTVLAVAFLAAVGQLLWRARPDLPRRAAWAGAAAAATAFALHSAFDFTWQVPAIPLTVGAIAGLGIPSAIHGWHALPYPHRSNERTN